MTSLQDKIYRRLYAAAEQEDPCPTNALLCQLFGQKSISGPARIIQRLEAAGRINVDRYHAARVVTITATGQSTARPPERQCVRRTLRRGECEGKPRKRAPAQHTAEVVEYVMGLFRSQRLYSDIVKLTGLRKSQIIGLISRNRTAADPPGSGEGANQCWVNKLGQTKADQNVRRENGQELLPFAIRRGFLPSVVWMKFKTCQYIEAEPSIDDACKCAQPTDGGPWCPDHKALCIRVRWENEHEGEAA